MDPGAYRVTLVEPRTQLATRFLELAADERRLDVDYVIPEGQVLRGRVFDQGTRDGVANATMILETSSQQHVTVTKSNAQGGYETPALEEGYYQFKIEPPGYQPKNESFEVGENAYNESNPLDIERLRPIARGQVVSASLWVAWVPWRVSIPGRLTD